jgi:hypothetical protein
MINYIDYGILAVLFIFALIGMYNGFVVSALGFLSSFFSWLVSLIFYPLVSKFLVYKYPDLIQKLVYYTEGASKIQSVEERAIPVLSLTKEQMANMVKNAQLPPPYDRLLLSNLINTRFQHFSSVGEYFNYTVAYIILNILCFVSLFVIIKIICIVAISIAKEVVGLPVLKRYDQLSGAGIGFVGGIFFVFLLFSLVSVLLMLIPLDIVYTYLENSLFGNFFLKSNIFTNFIRGFV